jgi:hypothetical protein
MWRWQAAGSPGCGAALGQVAQAIPDQHLLNQVSVLHKQTLTRIKWLETRIKEACPQILLSSGAAG